MAKASDNIFPKVNLGMQTSAPSAPADSSWKVYAKPGGVYARSSNSEVGPFGSGGGFAGTQNRVVLTSGSLSTTSTSFTDATGLSITMSTGAKRCLVGFTGVVYHNSNAQGIYIQLDIDGTDMGGTYGLVGEYTLTGASDLHNASFVYLTDTLTAASHTFKIQWRVTSGTGNLVANSDNPATLWVVELA